MTTPDPLRAALAGVLRGHQTEGGGYAVLVYDDGYAYHLATPEDFADLILSDEGVRAALATDTAPTGYHGDGEFDLHYDPWCPRCTEQRDRLRPPLEMDEVYAIVEDEK